MKKLGFIWVLLWGFALSASAQESLIPEGNLIFDSETEKTLWNEGSEDVFRLFRAVQANSQETEKVWTDLIAEMDGLASKQDDQLKLLRQIFQKTHQRLLRKYEQHSTFNAMLTEGKFDCVSGSAALGILLDRYGYSFEIVETDYHVFVVAQIEGKKIILESTLPVGGMITTPSEVEAYLASYKPEKNAQIKQWNQTLAGPEIDYSDHAIFRIVNLKELAGLQYYNDAIVHFNSQAYGKAVNQLSKAYLLYPSDRIEGLRELSIDLAYKTYGYDVKK